MTRPVPDGEEWTTAAGKKMSGHRCQGKSKRSQEQCERRAALGQDVCKMHGGGAPQARAAGQRRQLEQRIERDVRQAMDRGLIRPVDDPLGELARVAGEIVAFKDYLAGQVEDLNGVITYWTEASFSDAEGEFRTTATEQVRAVLAAYERALDRTAKVLATMVKLDLQGRLVAIREDEATRLVEAIRLGLGDVDMEAAVRSGAEVAIAARLEQVVGQPQESREIAG